MLAKVLSGALLGIDAYRVEVDIAQSLPQFATVGLPEGAVKESKDRIKSAIKNSGYEFPTRRITINLAPADIRKDGAAFDLPMAVGLLQAAGILKPAGEGDYLMMGELSLDGRIKPVRGILPVAVTARNWPIAGLIVPGENAREGALADGLPVFGAATLGEVVDFIAGKRELERCRADPDRLHANAAMQPRHIRMFCQLDAEGERLLEQATEKLGLSAQLHPHSQSGTYHADLAACEQISTAHLAESIQYRCTDRVQSP